jgi:hypothetical protein
MYEGRVLQDVAATFVRIFASLILVYRTKSFYMSDIYRNF